MKIIKEELIDKDNHCIVNKSKTITNAEFNKITRVLNKYKEGQFDKFLDHKISKKHFELKDSINYNDIKFVKANLQKNFITIEYLRYEKIYNISIIDIKGANINE